MEEKYLMNVYGQEAQHEEVFIVGSRERLMALRDAIETALEKGQGNSEASVNDGEFYDIYVICPKDEEVLKDMTMPYSAEWEKDMREKGTGPWELVNNE